MAGTTLGFAEAMTSPCSTCAGTFCCTHLPVHSFRVGSLADLDYVRYLLNFANIVVGLAPSGDWSVFYTAPCTHLEQTSGDCGVHGTAEQPHICAVYNPYTCWYKGAFSTDANDRLLRVDRRRWDHLVSGTRFDGDRRIVESRSWQELAADFAALPLVDGSEARGGGLAVNLSRSSRLRLQADPVPVPSGQETSVFPPSPCQGCAAPCCTNLVFPYPVPNNASHLDFLKFALGFPGVQVIVTADEWAVTVTSRCRHLDGTLCGVFGTDERPLRCKYYDEWKCTVKDRLGQQPPEGVVVVGAPEFSAVVSQFQLDSEGLICDGPSLAEMRRPPGR